MGDKRGVVVAIKEIFFVATGLAMRGYGSRVNVVLALASRPETAGSVGRGKVLSSGRRKPVVSSIVRCVGAIK